MIEVSSRSLQSTAHPSPDNLSGCKMFNTRMLSSATAVQIAVFDLLPSPGIELHSRPPFCKTDVLKIFEEWRKLTKVSITAEAFARVGHGLWNGENEKCNVSRKTHGMNPPNLMSPCIGGRKSFKHGMDKRDQNTQKEFGFKKH